MGEKVSIITISYNSEKSIEKTMLSVLEQSYRPLEYVLVDGRSTDGTIQLIESYIPKFQEAGIETNFKSEPDKGISDAFNKGIERPTGDIIGIINSDDALSENALEMVAEVFEEQSEAGVVCGDCLWIDETNRLQYIRKSKMELKKLKYEMVLMHPTCFVRKSVYEKYGTFDVNLKYIMDKELMARFYQNGVQFSYIPKTIAIMHSGGASDLNSDKVFDEGIDVAVKYGVPRWKAVLRSNYKRYRMKVVNFTKKSKLWKCFVKR